MCRNILYLVKVVGSFKEKRGRVGYEGEWGYPLTIRVNIVVSNLHEQDKNLKYF